MHRIFHKNLKRPKRITNQPTSCGILRVTRVPCALLKEAATLSRSWCICNCRTRGSGRVSQMCGLSLISSAARSFTGFLETQTQESAHSALYTSWKSSQRRIAQEWLLIEGTVWSRELTRPRVSPKAERLGLAAKFRSPEYAAAR